MNKLCDIAIISNESPIENAENYSIGDLILFNENYFIKLESGEVKEFILGCKECISALEVNNG
jgi:hypothetical protein